VHFCSAQSQGPLMPTVFYNLYLWCQVAARCCKGEVNEGQLQQTKPLHPAHVLHPVCC
jgi:hypothetical protein